ncbi:MAG: nuclear transport factor 2 family protein [Gammaproteobacteria bacterium]|nr:nuclear transport factor 2 family protein [Gammaproteobacteria bacterium]
MRAYVEAVNRGDLAAMQSLLDPDAQIQGVLGKGTFERPLIAAARALPSARCSFRIPRPPRSHRGGDSLRFQ